MKAYFIYIMGSPNGSALYIGITNNLGRRVMEHKSKVLPGFSAKYNCSHLLYFEETPDVRAAIEREKQLKKWSRAKKEWLIATLNPNRIDLSTSVEMTDG